MILHVLTRIAGIHLVQAEWRKRGGDHLQATIEGLAWRGVVAASGVLYAKYPKFAEGVDQVLAALSGG